MQRARWFICLGAAATVSVGSAVWAIGAASASPSTSGSPSTSTTASASTSPCLGIDGPAFDNTGADAGIGQPTRTVMGKADAGAIEVRYGCSPKLTVQGVHLPTPHAGDRFGTASVGVNINSGINETTGTLKDRYFDLLVGVPDYDVGPSRDAGAIAVYLGSSAGLTFSRLLTQDSPGVAGSVQAGAHFGSTLATAFIFDQSDITVRVGAPDLDFGTATDAGGIVDITFDRDGNITASHQMTEHSHDVPGSALAGDHFGAALWQLSAVGVPGKTVNGNAGAGAVVYDPGTDYFRFVSQDSPCVAGAAEAGDHFGAAVAGGWVGVPGEDIGGLVDAGMINHIGDSPDHCYALNQDSAGVLGTAESGDRFGATLGQIYFVLDDGYGGGSRLLIGVPGEDTAAVDAGMVDVVEEYDASDGSLDIEGFTYAPDPHPVTGGAFGSAISAARLGALIGAPGESGGRVYTFDLGSDQSPSVTRIATFRQTTGTKSNGYGAAFTSSSRV